MSQRQKAMDRLRSEPPVTNFTWDEMLSVLESFGYKMLKSHGGSHRKFVHATTKAVIAIPKPHPSNIVRRAYLRQVRDHLNDKG